MSIQLSDDERGEANRIVSKYRNDICGMGPFFDDFITEALKSEKKRAQIVTATERFFNSAYFAVDGHNGFPAPTRELIGIPVYQGQCRTKDCEIAGGGTTLKGYITFTTIIDLDERVENLVTIDRKWFDREILADGKTRISHPYHAETVFSTVEQFFLFMRALWYYADAILALHIYKQVAGKTTTMLMSRYMNFRHELVRPFIQDEFPLPNCNITSLVESLDAKALQEYYMKYFFSRISHVQQACAPLGKFIKTGIEKL